MGVENGVSCVDWERLLLLALKLMGRYSSGLLFFCAGYRCPEERGEVSTV